MNELERKCMVAGLKMTEQRRVILQVLAEAADHPSVDAVYHRAKAVDHGPDGIRVNCVAPGPVYTPRMYTGQMTPAGREARRKASVLGVEGNGWDIGFAVRFLMSAEARYITGQTLVVDGGATLVGPGRAPG